MRKILMIVPPREFRDAEYIVLRALWEQEGSVKISTASITKLAVGRFGYEVDIDHNVHKCVAEDWDGVFFVGGGGSLAWAQDANVQELVRDFQLAQKPIGAICAAPRVLLQWGTLEDTRMTGWNGDHALEEMAPKHGAQYVGGATVVDNDILTAENPEAAEEAALEFLKLLD